MIREQDVVVFQGCGDERSALGPSISHPVNAMFKALLARLESQYPYTDGGKCSTKVTIYEGEDRGGDKDISTAAAIEMTGMVVHEDEYYSDWLCS